jgi:hypothetical protein
VIVSVTDGDLADHDTRLGGGAVERLPSHGNQTQAIAVTLLVIVRVLLDDSDLDNDQTLSRTFALRKKRKKERKVNPSKCTTAHAYISRVGSYLRHFLFSHNG